MPRNLVSGRLWIPALLFLASFILGAADTAVEVNKAIVVHLTGGIPAATLAVPVSPRVASHSLSPLPRASEDQGGSRLPMLGKLSIFFSRSNDVVLIELRGFLGDRGIGPELPIAVKSGRAGQEVRFDELAEYGVEPLSITIEELGPPGGVPVDIGGSVTEHLPVVALL